MLTPPWDRPVARTVVEVRSYELDSFGHANHAVFLNYLELARFEALRQVGFPYQDIIARGWGIYVVRVEVDYLKEACLGDRLEVRTWAEAYKRSSMVLAQQIVRAEQPDQEVTRGRITAVWVDRERKPMRVPADVREALGGGDTPPLP